MGSSHKNKSGPDEAWNLLIRRWGKPALAVLLLAVVPILGYLRRAREGRDLPPAFQAVRMDMALEELQVELSRADRGRSGLPPSRALAALRDTLALKRSYDDRERRRWRDMGLFLPRPLPFLLAGDGKPWRVVLSARDDHGTVVATVFGEDPTRPAQVREFSCCP